MPRIQRDLQGKQSRHPTEEDSIDDVNNSGTDDCNWENDDEIDNGTTYFNYNYSYDFAPDWIKDAKETLN